MEFLGTDGFERELLLCIFGDLIDASCCSFLGTG